MKLYLESDSSWFRSAATHNDNPTDEMVKEAITNSQYGKCVFKCDNDVVDHQTLNMLFEDDITVTFSMNEFNKGGRFIHIMGTKGEIHAATDGDSPIRIYDFETKKEEIIEIKAADGMENGHGGGDDGIIKALYEYIAGNYTEKSISDIGETCYNHFIVFAAEKARDDGVIVDMEEWIKELNEQI